jgi:hypothetical protein
MSAYRPRLDEKRDRSASSAGIPEWAPHSVEIFQRASMKIHAIAIAIALCACAVLSVRAQTPSASPSSTPTDASVEELLQVCGIEKFSATMQTQIKGMFTNAMNQGALGFGYSTQIRGNQ